MPTGYTADIKDGISFQTYAMNCARAFGACIELRDEPGGGERIPQAFEPSDYHKTAAAKDRAELLALDAMTAAQCEHRAAREWDDAETRRAVRLQEKQDQEAAYRAMLAKVNAWTPPTDEHLEFQRFMREQIEQSIRFDCGGSYYATPTLRKTGAQWLADTRKSLEDSIALHDFNFAEDVKRAEGRTAWVNALRSSLE